MKMFLLAAILALQAVSQAGVKVGGRVLHQDPNLASQQNSVRLSGNGRPFFTTIAADGTFQFPNVPAGTYQIEVGPRVTMPPVSVVVTDKDVIGLELRVPAAPVPAPRGNQGNTNNTNLNNQSNNRGGATGNSLIEALDAEQIQALIESLGGRGGPRGNAANAQALKQIAVFDRQGQLLNRVNDPAPASMISMSPDGARVAYTQNDGDIVALNLASKTGVRIASGGRGAPAWSPDGSRIAYLATRNGVSGLYVRPSNGTGDEELFLASANGLFQWSQDGRFIVAGVGVNFVALPTAGDRRTSVIFSTSGRTGLSLSPDSRFLAYMSTESGSSQVWIRTFDPTGAAESSTGITQWRVSAGTAVGLVHWRNDGRELYYLASDGAVMAVPITTAPAFKAETPVLLFRVPADFPLQPNAASQQADISADGQRFVFLSPVAGVPAPASTVNNNNGRGRGGNTSTNPNANINDRGNGNNTAPNNRGTASPALAASTAVIAGRIMLPNGTPATRFRVAATTVREKEGSVTGTWVTVGVTNSPWTIQLTIDGSKLIGTVDQVSASGHDTRSIEDGRVDGNAVSFKVQVSNATNTRVIVFTGTVKGDEITLNRAVQILTGSMDTGQGINGSQGPAVITARRDTSGFETFTETDSAGRYRFDRLPAGRYRLSAGFPEAPTYFPGVASAADATIVMVGPNGNVDGRDFNLTAPIGR